MRYILKYYYSIPFDTRLLAEKKKHPLCSLKDSIQMNINLIIRTHIGENRYNNSYGCLIWNKDYSTITDVSKWKDELRSHIAASIEENEPRINEIQINLNIEDSELSDKFRDHPIKLKKKITIQISGIIKHLNEPFEYYEHLFFSPFSIG
jgi:phage baseplate assembly protein W